MKTKKIRLHIIQFAFLLAVIGIFALLFFKYYESQFADSQRFVSADYDTLEEEASRIVSSYGKDGKNAEDVFVLTYHAITKEPTDKEFRISYDDFKETMFALKEEGYQTVTLSDFYAFMRGEKELPDKSFLLTFDDGTKQSYYNGDPILKALNYTAVLFVITYHSVDAPESVYYLNEEELKQAHETGRWEIASHTDKTHFRLPTSSAGEISPALTNRLWIENEGRIETEEEYYERVSSDLKNSKEKLEELLNKSVIAFALPYGDFGERRSNYPKASEILINITYLNYDLIFYEFPYKYRIYRSNYNDDKYNENYILSRIPSDHLSKDHEELLNLIEASRSVELPYYEDYSNQDRWVRISGRATFNNESISLYPDSEINSRLSITSYLDGSYMWEDYTYTAQLKESDASVVSLISRFKDPENFVACKFQGDTVSIIRAKKGEPQRTILSERIPNNQTILPNSRISMSVYDNRVACYIGSEKIISEVVSDIPSHGGVGIRADGFPNEGSVFEFGEISIVPISNPNIIFFEKDKTSN